MTGYTCRFAIAMAITAFSPPISAQDGTVAELRAKADQGDAVAQVNLGRIYHDGRGVPQDDTAAVRWFQLAADQGDAVAQVNLGRMYRDGRGVPQDDAAAVQWYRLAADQGLAVAQVNLGSMYEDGRGVPQDYVQAHMWYNLSAARWHGVERESMAGLRDFVAEQMAPAQIAEAERLAYEWIEAHPRQP